MKFILEEKLILDEKFILLEDTPDEPTDETDKIKAIAEYSDEISDLITSLKGFSGLGTTIKNNLSNLTKALANIQTSLDAFQELVRTNQVWNTKHEVFKEAENFIKDETLLIDTFEEIIPHLVEIDKVNKTPKFNETDARQKVNNIRGALNSLSKSIKSLKDKSQTADREQLVEQIQKDLFALEKFVNQAHINAWFNMLIKNVEIFDLIEANLEEENRVQDQIKDFIASNAFLKKLPKEYQDDFINTYNDIDSLFKSHQAEMLAYCAFDVFSKTPNARKMKSTLAGLLEIIKELFAKLSEINDKLARWKIETEEIVKKSFATDKVIDWEREFDNAVELDKNRPAGADSANVAKDSWNSKSAVEQTWTRYYSKEWKGYSNEALAKIGSAFQKELLSLGFTESRNPFITFLRTMLTNSQFVSAIKAKPTAYSCIHNAYIDKLISAKDLQGKGLLAGANIIFNPNLYNKSTPDIQKYLTLQAKVIYIFDKAGGTPKFTDYAKVDKKEHPTPTLLAEKYSSKPQAFVTDLFCEPGNVLVGEVQRKNGNTKGELYAVDWVERNLSLCFDSETIAETEANINANISVGKGRRITSADIVKLATNLKAKIDKEITNAAAKKTARKKIMKALLSSSKTLPSVSEWDKKYALRSIVLSQVEIEEILKKYFADYNIAELFTEPSKEALLKNLVQELGSGLESKAGKGKADEGDDD